jgi:hypothetical protein
VKDWILKIEILNSLSYRAFFLCYLYRLNPFKSL